VAQKNCEKSFGQPGKVLGVATLPTQKLAAGQSKQTKLKPSPILLLRLPLLHADLTYSLNILKFGKFLNLKKHKHLKL